MGAEAVTGLMERAAELVAGAEDWAWFLRGLEPPVRRGLLHDWSWQAHAGQRAPAGDWRLWVGVGGGGGGESHAGGRGRLHAWSWRAHAGQRAPAGDWRLWLLMAGRGFGKTYAGAQWVLEQARANPGARIALVGGSADEVAKVMVEGAGGVAGVGG